MQQAIKHGLDKDLARKALKKAFDSYKDRFAKYNPSANWKSEDKADIGFTAKGVTLEGSVELTEDTVLLDLDVPFFLKPFKGKALGIIDEEIKAWIAKAKRGELDET